MVRTVSGVSTGPWDGQHQRAASGCGATITETEADVAAGLEILAAIRRAQIELGGCKVLRRSPPICGCCLVLWRRWCFTEMLMIAAVAGGERDGRKSCVMWLQTTDSARVFCVQSLENYQDARFNAARYILHL